MRDDELIPTVARFAVHGDDMPALQAEARRVAAEFIGDATDVEAMLLLDVTLDTVVDGSGRVIVRRWDAEVTLTIRRQPPF